LLSVLIYLPMLLCVHLFEYLYFSFIDVGVYSFLDVCTLHMFNTLFNNFKQGYFQEFELGGGL